MNQTKDLGAGRLFPVTKQDLPRVDSGNGVYLYDEKGRKYLDGSSGAVAANLGHGNVRMADALAAQARSVSFAHRMQFRSRPTERLAELIAERAPGDLRWSIFTSSGSEANEIALRVALRYWTGIGRSEKCDFLSRALSYHGSTLGALSLTGQPHRRAGVEPLLHGFPRLHKLSHGPHLPSPEGLLDELGGMDPSRVAAVVTEPVGGASGGASVPPAGYYEHLRAWCDANEVLWIADEVMSGFGRTGKWFAVEHWSAVPDILVFGKGVSGGYAPLAGVVSTGQVAEAILAGPGFLSFGHTYSNVPITSAVGVSAINEIDRRGLVENARKMGELLESELERLATSHSCVAEHRGMGLLRAIELVDPSTREPWPKEEEVAQRVIAMARDEGLLLYPAGQGMYDGCGVAALVSPPLIISSAEVYELAHKLDRTLSRLESRSL